MHWDIVLKPADALSQLPAGLRAPLISEYSSIAQNFSEHRWAPTELSGGLFCEISYTILKGHANGNFPPKPSKPKNFVQACRDLENNSHVPRSFQILIPRLLPSLYEIRNNRGVGHVGGDVDPNQMDAAAVLSMTSWVMAEFVRVFHALDIPAAQATVDALIERPMPFVWVGDGTKRILDPSLNLRNQILILLSSSVEPVSIDDLQNWLKYKNRNYLNKLLQELDDDRSVYISDKDKCVRLLPKGVNLVSNLVSAKLIESQ